MNRYTLLEIFQKLMYVECLSVTENVKDDFENLTSLNEFKNAIKLM